VDKFSSMLSSINYQVKELVGNYEIKKGYRVFKTVSFSVYQEFSYIPKPKWAVRDSSPRPSACKAYPKGITGAKGEV
jgi:hypothetical protein